MTNHDQKFPWFPAIKIAKLFQRENRTVQADPFVFKTGDTRTLLFELVAKGYKEHVVI